MNQAFRAIYARFGEELFLEARSAACQRRQFSAELIQKAVSYGLEVYRPRSHRQARQVTPWYLQSAVTNQIAGMHYGIWIAADSNSQLCAENTEDSFRRSAVSFSNALDGEVFTNQVLDVNLEVGGTQDQLRKTLGEPVYAEELGPITAEHYC